MPNQTRLVVQVQPDARRSEVVGFENGVLQLRVAAPPVKGKANRELIEFLSELLGVSKGNIVLEKGKTSRKKLVVINGLEQSQILDRLTSYSNPLR